MKKIELELDALAVESFDTAAAPGERGTVAAHARPTFNGCGSEIDACPSARGCTFVGGCVTDDFCDTRDDCA